MTMECRLITIPIRHDERTKESYTDSDVIRITKARDGNWGAEDFYQPISGYKATSGNWGAEDSAGKEAATQPNNK